jgi:cellulose synthase/poly-beta-1,6-N-acetylglucosamine synthase-like glycosyltransferase
MIPLAVTIVICVVGLAYLAIAAAVARRILRPHPTRKDLPRVSFVVAARNEEQNLPALLDSILRTDYPLDRLQIVIANDQSTDRTGEIAESCRNRFRCEFIVHDVHEEPEANLQLKSRALCQGLDYATGEVIVMTDADCILPAWWIRGMASYFVPGVGMVCGTTIPCRRSGISRLLTSFETLDWLYLLGSSAGLASLGVPKGLVGNNFSVRRSTYQRLGTYRLIEDRYPYADL